MKYDIRSDQSGFGLSTIIVLVATMIAGYIVITRILENEDVKEVRDTASDVVEKANDTIESANEIIDAVPLE